MSEREQAKQIIDRLPEYKIRNILLFLKGVAFDDDIEDDLYCEKLYQDYLNDPDPEKDTTYTLEECMKEWGAWMMYKIVLKKKAKKFIDKLPKNERLRIVKAIGQLPNGEDIKKMKGHSGLFRLRVGEYRIIYTVDNGELIVCVIDAGNRGEIYNRY